MNVSFSHVALLVPSAANSAKFLNSLNIETGVPEVFENEGSKEIYVGSYSENQGLLLLVEAHSQGPYERALLKRGPSLHHIAIDVLELESFLKRAQSVGWNLHPISAESKAYNTVWLFYKGIPTLIEVHQKKTLSQMPYLVSKIELQCQESHLALFEKIGLSEIIHIGIKTCLTIGKRNLSFSEIAKIL